MHLLVDHMYIYTCFALSREAGSASHRSLPKASRSYFAYVWHFELMKLGKLGPGGLGFLGFPYERDWDS